MNIGLVDGMLAAEIDHRGDYETLHQFKPVRASIELNRGPLQSRIMDKQKEKRRLNGQSLEDVEE